MNPPSAGEYARARNILFAWLPSVPGEPREGFACAVGVCRNIGCPCRDMVVRAFPVTETQEDLPSSDAFDPQPSDAEIELLVNVDSGAVVLHPEARPACRSEELLEKFRRCVDPEFVQVLRDRFEQERREVEETYWLSADWSHIAPGDMVPWMDAYPGVDDAVFEYEGDRYVVVDSYCVTPGCSCRDAMVSFALITRGKQDLRGTEVGALRVDTRRWRVRERHPLRRSEATIMELWKTCRSAFPDLKRTMAQRAKKMRRFGAVVYGPQPETAETEAKKSAGPVGRNDPCPCGSGKKYKKCCG